MNFLRWIWYFDVHYWFQSIKFTVESSSSSINFLDITVYKSNNTLFTKVYKKPTDWSLYLHSNSYHPNNLKRNIPYGQALRLKKICSENDNYLKSLASLKTSFLERVYTNENLEHQFQKASNKQRADLLSYKKKEKKANAIPFITTFHKQLPDFRSVIQKHWNLLQINQGLKDVFKNPPVFGYRRNRNLKTWSAKQH